MYIRMFPFLMRICFLRKHRKVKSHQPISMKSWQFCLGPLSMPSPSSLYPFPLPLTSCCSFMQSNASLEQPSSSSEILSQGRTTGVLQSCSWFAYWLQSLGLHTTHSISRSNTRQVELSDIFSSDDNRGNNKEKLS